MRDFPQNLKVEDVKTKRSCETSFSNSFIQFNSSQFNSNSSQFNSSEFNNSTQFNYIQFNSIQLNSIQFIQVNSFNSFLHSYILGHHKYPQHGSSFKLPLIITPIYIYTHIWAFFPTNMFLSYTGHPQKRENNMIFTGPSKH